MDWATHNKIASFIWCEGGGIQATKIGCEISFPRRFYQPKPLRTLARISADVLAIERAEGLWGGLLVQGERV